MARFRSVGCFVFGSVKYRAGTVFASDSGSALAGDVVPPGGLTSAQMSPAFVPLDGTASTMMAGSRFANTPTTTIDGANSVHG